MKINDKVKVIKIIDDIDIIDSAIIGMTGTISYKSHYKNEIYFGVLLANGVEMGFKEAELELITS